MRILAGSALLLVLAAPYSAAAQKETETVDKTLTLGQNGRLELNTFSGDVRISGTSGTEVVIRAVRRGTRDRLDRIKLDISQSGSTVTIEANRREPGWRDEENNVVETDFDIKVPRGTSLDLDAFSSHVDIRGVAGEIEANTFSGNIEIDVAGAGQVPTLTAETFSGNIEARVPASTSARVRFDSFSGSVRSDLPISMTGRRSRGSDVDGAIGSGSGPTLRFKTFSGDLRITK